MPTDQIVPEQIVNISHETLGLIGHLVIDTRINGRFSGGLRILPDVTVNELTYLARNMTLKFGFWRIPMGGAKSCVFVDSKSSFDKRTQVLEAFGKSLSAMIKSDRYAIGFDMGVVDSDLERIYASAGYVSQIRGQDAKTHVYTSWTMFVSAKVAADHLGFDLSGSAVAIEGFGNVGSSAARLFSQAGAKIIAVSTIEGALYDPNGLDMGRLFRLREKVGDKLVKEYPAKRISNQTLLTLETDILMPCARPWSINSYNVAEVKCKMICPGANVPMATDIEQRLHARKIFCIPDFVANSGGVLGAHLRSIASEGQIADIIKDQFRKKLENIIRVSHDKNVTPGKISRETSLRQFTETKRKSERDLFQRNFVKNALKLLPKKIKMTLTPTYMRRKLGSTE